MHVQGSASLHERAVQRVAADNLSDLHKDRATETRPRTTRVTSRKVDPALWRVAMRLAGGKVSRLTVEPDGSVSVSN